MLISAPLNFVCAFEYCVAFWKPKNTSWETNSEGHWIFNYRKLQVGNIYCASTIIRPDQHSDSLQHPRREGPPPWPPLMRPPRTGKFSLRRPPINFPFGGAPARSVLFNAYCRCISSVCSFSRLRRSRPGFDRIGMVWIDEKLWDNIKFVLRCCRWLEAAMKSCIKRAWQLMVTLQTLATHQAATKLQKQRRRVPRFLFSHITLSKIKHALFLR